MRYIVEVETSQGDYLTTVPIPVEDKVVEYLKENKHLQMDEAILAELIESIGDHLFFNLGRVVDEDGKLTGWASSVPVRIITRINVRVVQEDG